jgi:hypothetical protein
MSKIILKNVRVSFPSLLQRAKFNEEETNYQATFILDKDTQIKLIEGIQNKIEKLTAKTFNCKNLEEHRVCLRDGDTFSYEPYANHMCIKASSKTQPIVDGNPLEGDYVNAIIQIWPQTKYGNRINAKLLYVSEIK